MGYVLAESAVRFAILLGLNDNVPEAQLPNRVLREHRVRVWWTVYILDRTWASWLGQSVSIRDEDISVNLPSVEGLPQDALEDFADPEYLIAGFRMANLAANISTSIYSRKMQRESFSARVQQALRDLRTWTDELPGDLRISMDGVQASTALPIITLQLFFNQVRGLLISSSLRRWELTVQ